MSSKQKVIWLQDKGKNCITRDEVIPELLNMVAAWRDPNMVPKILIEKEFGSPSMTIEEKLASLTPPLLPVPCPLAHDVLGLPLVVYAYAEAKSGSPPTKGDPNMVAQLLTRRMDGTSRPIRGKALVCLKAPLMGPGNLDLPVDLLVKLLFFAADLYKDTIGTLEGAELDARLKDAPLFFKFYGPGRHVMAQMTELHIMDPAKGRGGPVQVVTVAMLKAQQEMAAQRQQMAMRNTRLPAFMQEGYMQDGKFLGELKEIVLRGWQPPSAVAPGNPEDEGGAAAAGGGAVGGGAKPPAEDTEEEEQKGEAGGEVAELDFSDLGA